MQATPKLQASVQAPLRPAASSAAFIISCAVPECSVMLQVGAGQVRAGHAQGAVQRALAHAGEGRAAQRRQRQLGPWHRQIPLACSSLCASGIVTVRLASQLANAPVLDAALSQLSQARVILVDCHLSSLQVPQAVLAGAGEMENWTCSVAWPVCAA